MTVKYFSDAWMVLIKLGYVTWFVDKHGDAVMKKIS